MAKTRYELVDEANEPIGCHGWVDEVPAVGDSIVQDDGVYVVKRRTWRTAKDVLDADVMRYLGFQFSTIMHVSLVVTCVADVTACDPA